MNDDAGRVESERTAGARCLETAGSSTAYCGEARTYAARCQRDVEHSMTTTYCNRAI
jgi:hypothetical protein